jgi:hypothetical protein
MADTIGKIFRYLNPRHDFDRVCINPSEKEFLRKLSNGKFDARVNEPDLGLAVIKGFCRGGPLGLLMGTFYDAASGHPGSGTALGALLGMMLDSGQILVRDALHQPSFQTDPENPEFFYKTDPRTGTIEIMFEEYPLFHYTEEQLHEILHFTDDSYISRTVLGLAYDAIREFKKKHPSPTTKPSAPYLSA